MNQTGKFEEQIRAGRSRMDIEEPDDDRIWKKIESGLLRQKRLRLKRFLIPASVAASVLIILSAGYALLTGSMDLSIRDSIRDSIREELREYQVRKNEARYKRLIRFREQEIKEQGIDPQIIDYYKRDLEILDSIYQYCLRDLQHSGYNERTLMIMLDTYEKRIRIYDRIHLENQRIINIQEHENKTLL